MRQEIIELQIPVSMLSACQILYLVLFLHKRYSLFVITSYIYVHSHLGQHLHGMSTTDVRSVPLQSITLDLPPSCIEVCPAHPDYFCIGTYSLEQDEKRARGDTTRPQNRNGSIILFKVEGTSLYVNFICRMPPFTEH